MFAEGLGKHGGAEGLHVSSGGEQGKITHRGGEHVLIGGDVCLWFPSLSAGEKNTTGKLSATSGAEGDAVSSDCFALKR